MGISDTRKKILVITRTMDTAEKRKQHVITVPAIMGVDEWERRSGEYHGVLLRGNIDEWQDYIADWDMPMLTVC